MSYINYKRSCSTCGRKLLIEINLNGSNHNLSVNATCGECIKPEELNLFEETWPREAKAIREWIQATGAGTTEANDATG